MFHYVEYKIHGSWCHTQRSGALNDLEGNGLICEVKKRGGVVTLHKEGTKDYITEYISFRINEIAERQAVIIEGIKQNKTRV